MGGVLLSSAVIGPAGLTVVFGHGGSGVPRPPDPGGPLVDSEDATKSTRSSDLAGDGSEGRRRFARALDGESTATECNGVRTAQYLVFWGLAGS